MAKTKFIFVVVVIEISIARFSNQMIKNILVLTLNCLGTVRNSMNTHNLDQYKYIRHKYLLVRNYCNYQVNSST